MRAVCSGLMTVWLAILTVSGWCCHGPIVCAHDSQASATANTKCCSRCGGQSGQQNESTRPLEDGSACQGVCIYLPSPKVQLDDEQVPAWPDLPAILPMPQESQVASAQHSHWAFEATLLGPPLRLHLLHQLLLI
jgi:hypothetical protein